MDIKINTESKLFGVIPKIAFKDKGSYIESSTREYDIMAFKYLSRAVYPLLICYGIYSLIYQEHKGWYSWVLSMLYGFLLTFGKLSWQILIWFWRTPDALIWLLVGSTISSNLAMQKDAWRMCCFDFIIVTEHNLMTDIASSIQNRAMFVCISPALACLTKGLWGLKWAWY